MGLAIICWWSHSPPEPAALLALPIRFCASPASTQKPAYSRQFGTTLFVRHHATAISPAHLVDVLKDRGASWGVVGRFLETFARL